MTNLPPELRETFHKLLNRQAGSYKYNFGHVLILGGSLGMVGAPLLAAQAAQRAGAGMATIAAEPAVIDSVEGNLPEVLTLRLPATGSERTMAVRRFCDDKQVNCIIIGPGTTDGLIELAVQLIETVTVPVIVDGGALSAFDKLLTSSGGPRIITPHRGEFARFFEDPLPDDESALLELAAKFAAQHDVNLVLKGQPVQVLAPSQQMFTNPTGGPALATAGSGDTLTGVIGGLVAQGIEPFEAACGGVYLGSLAADIAASELTQPAVIASDIAGYLPRAYKLIQGEL